MSGHYRQSSKVPPDLVQRDPNNCLRSRPAGASKPMLRDQMLTVSGLQPQNRRAERCRRSPTALVQVVYSGDKWETSG
jgi:hypothetical protein